jgi:hypothetical protein
VFSCFRGLPLVCALLCASCGARLMKLPAGPGAPAADAAEAIADATAACRNVSTFSAEIGVSGSIGGQRLRGRLLVGLASPASARIEAVAPVGAPVFIFVASGQDATVLLPRDSRVLEHGPADSVLEAVAGVPLDPADLKAALTGCAQAPDPARGRSLGDHWRVVPDGPTDLYLHRDPKNLRWQVAAAVHRGRGGSQAESSGSSPEQPTGDWRAEYRDVQAGLPRSIHFAGGQRFDLNLSLSQVSLNEPLGAEVFRVEIPPSAEPITLDELRHARPGVREN